MSLIILWNNRADNWLKRRLRAVGRMALTNYLMQTVLGVLVLTTLLGRCRLCEPKRRLGLRVRSVGPAAVVVASVVESLPLRTRRVALASRHIPKRTAASPPQ